MPGDEGQAIAGDAVALGEHRVGDPLGPGGQPTERLGLRGDRLAGTADAGHDAGVLAVDALREVELLEQVRKAVGLQDDADDVRPAALVAADELLGEDVLGRPLDRLQAAELRLGGIELVADAQQL